MKARLLIACCVTAVANPVQAEIREYRYTAAVQVITATEQLLGDALRLPTAPDQVIVVGDTVTGRFSLDSNAALLQTYYPDVGYTESYYRYGSGLPVSLRFDDSGDTYTALRDRSYLAVTDSTARYQADFLGVAGDVSPYIRLYVDFSDPTTTALDTTALDIGALDRLPVRQFRYEYLTFVNEYWLLTSVRGTLTSLTLVSVVPEPASYAMLAIGLCLLAWCRRHH